LSFGTNWRFFDVPHDRAHVVSCRKSRPGGQRREMTWRDCIRAHRESLLAVDFFTVQTIWLQRLYILFFIESGSRRVHLAGCTANQDAEWVIQQARQVS
jgi:putative transposase